MRLLAMLRRYIAAQDPLVATTNLIAMVLGWNTPFYPLYVLGSGGASMAPAAWFTALAFPVYLAVPAVTRHHPLAGRIMLVATAIANTVYCTWLLGEASGTQLFLVPCIALALLLFRRTEATPLVTLICAPVLAGLALNGRYPASAVSCMGDACSGLFWLNVISVVCLFGFFGLLVLRRLITSAKPLN